MAFAPSGASSAQLDLADRVRSALVSSEATPGGLESVLDAVPQFVVVGAQSPGSVLSRLSSITGSASCSSCGRG